MNVAPVSHQEFFTVIKINIFFLSKLLFIFYFLQSLLKTADQLKIKGLCEVPDGNSGSESEGSSTDFKAPLNLFGSEYQSDEISKNYNYGNVTHSGGSKNSYVSSELILNQTARIKQSDSPPLTGQENFVSVKQTHFGGTSESQSHQAKRQGTKR